MQYLFFSSRREVYSILKAEGILLPRYAVLNRDPNNPQGKKNRDKLSTISISLFPLENSMYIVESEILLPRQLIFGV